jgi:hypothetical protein
MTVHMGAPSSMARTPSRTKPREMQRYQTLPRFDHRREDTISLCGDLERWLVEPFLPQSGGEKVPLHPGGAQNVAAVSGIAIAIPGAADIIGILWRRFCGTKSWASPV